MGCFEWLPDELLPAVLGAPAAHLRLVRRRWLRALRRAFPNGGDRTPKGAAAGSAELAAWYYELDPTCRDWLCEEAARAGHLAALQWARAQRPPGPWSASTCRRAAEGGNLALLQWARAHGAPLWSGGGRSRGIRPLGVAAFDPPVFSPFTEHD